MPYNESWELVEQAVDIIERAVLTAVGRGWYKDQLELYNDMIITALELAEQDAHKDWRDIKSYRNHLAKTLRLTYRYRAVDDPRRGTDAMDHIDDCRTAEQVLDDVWGSDREDDWD